MNDLVKGQGLGIRPEIKRVHEIMDEFRKDGRFFTEDEIESIRNQAYQSGYDAGCVDDNNLYSISG